MTHKANIPISLEKGDTIGVFAPSSYIKKDDIEKSKSLMEDHGFKVFIHPQTYEKEHQSAGSHLQKTLAFQGLWQRKDIKAIWAAGGGNRCLHLLNTINFKQLNNTAPKILIGFSDVTALINAVYAYNNIVTFHGPIFKNVHKYKQLSHLLKLLSSELVSYPINKDNILKTSSNKVTGHLIGGNLSIFQYLAEILPSNFYKDGILFLEDCNEELSKIDRMLLHLKNTQVLNNINALIFGQFTNIKETGRKFGYSLEDIILEHTENLDITILRNMPFGHGGDLYTMPIGIKAEINTTNNKEKFTLLEPASYSYKP